LAVQFSCIMWKHLKSGDHVSVGDKIRFIGAYLRNQQDAYTVIKADQHYFQVIPAVEKQNIPEQSLRARIVKYFEIGYNLKLEIWIDEASLIPS
jgi:hypothetical protein